jgi:glycosyltransferase involved in cell wall biosynthesis
MEIKIKPKPLVSVIIPSYNYAHMIGNAIESVQHQTFQDWELVISDDGSTDNSVGVIEHFRSTDERIRVFQTPHNLGIYGNIVECIKRSQGTYIKILMADDWLHVDYLTRVLDIFRIYPSIAFCSVRTAIYVERAGKRVFKKTRVEPIKGKVFYSSSEMLQAATNFVNPIGNPSRVTFRKEIYDEVGGFDLSVEYCTEYELWLRMLKDYDCAVVNDTLSYELLHERNATRDYAKHARHLTTGEQMFVKLFEYLPYWRGKFWRKQSVWLCAWKDYWYVAIEDALYRKNSIQLKTLIAVLGRRSLLILWLPLLFLRGSHIILARTANEVLKYGRSRNL